MADNEKTITEKEYVVGGYTFKSKQEAQDAKDEINAIKYLSKKTDGSDAKQVYILYNQIIDRQLFSTTIGINYLKELQQFLYQSDDIPDEKIRPIPVKSDIQLAIDRRRERSEHRSELRNLSIKVARYKNNFNKLLIINIALVIAIIAMFIILQTSSNSNVVNYEVNIQNKYASWQSQLKSQEESLKQREKDIEAREEELRIKEATTSKK